MDDYEKLLAPLSSYTDNRLWQVVNDTLTETEKDRYQALLDQRSSGQMTEQEQREIERLADKIEVQMLLRSRALVLLKERGHDIERLLKIEPHVFNS